MNLTFSAHALDRCFERRISLQGVLDALRQGTCVKGSGMKDGERFVMASATKSCPCTAGRPAQDTRTTTDASRSWPNCKARPVS